MVEARSNEAEYNYYGLSCSGSYCPADKKIKDFILLELISDLIAPTKTLIQCNCKNIKHTGTNSPTGDNYAIGDSPQTYKSNSHTPVKTIWPLP